MHARHHAREYHAREYHLSAAGPLAERASAAAPQPALPGFKPPPISSVRDRVANGLTRFRCRVRKQPHQTRPLRALLREQVTG
jgi:hypothetical protein